MLLSSHHQIYLLHKPPFWGRPLKGTETSPSISLHWNMKSCNCIYLIFITHSVSSVCWQMILLTKSGRSRKLLEQAVQFSHLAAVWAVITWSSEARIKSVLGTHTLTNHSDKPHSTVSHCRAQQLSNSWADICSFHSEGTAVYSWIQIKRQTEALQVFIIYLIVGHQRSTTHFSWAH